MASSEDRLDIREVVERFSDALNHRNFEALGPLFTEDGIWEVEIPIVVRFEGRAQVVAGLAETVGSFEFLVQNPSPVVIELQDAATASARTSIQEFGRNKDGTTMRIAGTYFDSFRKEDGIWRFTHRRFRARYADGPELSGHVFG